VIDELMARRFWPGEDAIGKRVRFALVEGPWHTVVGVVGNVTFNGPGVEFPTFYHSHAQSLKWAGDLMARSALIAIRTTGDPNLLARPLRELVRGLDPQQAIASVATMDEILASSVAGPRFIMALFTVFAGLALAFGAIGVYGVISYGVARRTAEFGIRQALGASRTALIQMVLREGATLAGAGMLVGLAAALAVTRLLTGFLHEVSATDPLTFCAVALGVSVTALLSSYFPARRATKIDPMTALRRE
jgi:predicted lysophospholipase L1 biosynthesis ABC-type transport system permease subunit